MKDRCWNPPKNFSDLIERTHKTYGEGFLTIADMKHLPPVAYVIEPYIVRGAITYLIGGAGEFKSLAYVISLATMRGEAFLGHFPVRTSGCVCYFDADNPRSIVAERSMSMDFDPALDRGFLYFSFADGIALDTTDGLARILDIAKRFKPVLVVFDTTRHFHHRKENDSDDMAVVTEALRSVANLGPAVLALHHPSKNSSSKTTAARGSGEIIGGADVELNMTRVGKSDIASLQSVKTRLAPIPPIKLKLALNAEGKPRTLSLYEGAPIAQADAIESIAPTDPPGMSREAIHAALLAKGNGDGAKPSKRTLARRLEDLAAQGRLSYTTGPRGSHLYYRACEPQLAKNHLARSGTVKSEASK